MPLKNDLPEGSRCRVVAVDSAMDNVIELSRPVLRNSPHGIQSQFRQRNFSQIQFN